MLPAAQKDPDKIVTVRDMRLASQPALRRLKDGLVDAQLATARLRGTRSEDHPRVAAERHLPPWLATRGEGRRLYLRTFRPGYDPGGLEIPELVGTLLSLYPA